MSACYFRSVCARVCGPVLIAVHACLRSHRLHAITQLCHEFGVPLLVNNAYGVQSVRCMRVIDNVGMMVKKGAADQLRGVANNGRFSFI